jgi:hypothetical protein
MIATKLWRSNALRYDHYKDKWYIDWEKWPYELLDDSA